MLLTVGVVQSGRPEAWLGLEESLAHLSRDMNEAALGLHDRGSGALADSWADAVGELAGAEFKALAAGYEIVAIQLRAVCSVLSGLGVTLTGCQREVADWVTACSLKGCTWSDDGGVTPPLDAPVGLIDWAAAAQQALRDCLRRATEADEQAAAVLTDWRLASLDTNGDGRIEANVDLSAHLKETLSLGVGGGIGALRAGVPVDGSPAEQRRWWDGLSEAKRGLYLRGLPLELAGMAGLPGAVRAQLRRADLGYDRLRMLEYANEHWDDESIDWTDNPNDGREINNCTNFVSRSLEAGGLPPKGLTPWSADSWGHLPWAHRWRHPGAYSDSWGGADQQHDLFTHSGSPTVGVAGAQPGDVIYWMHTTDGNGHAIGEEHHAAVVTRVLPNGDILYTQHSNSAVDLSLDGRLAVSNHGGDQDIQIVRVQRTW